jgi:hypothetical protein
MLVQAALSIFWSLLALCAMAMPRMSGGCCGSQVRRWWCGCDQNLSGHCPTLEAWNASFRSSAWACSCLIGYLSPVPPRTAEKL